MCSCVELISLPRLKVVCKNVYVCLCMYFNTYIFDENEDDRYYYYPWVNIVVL